MTAVPKLVGFAVALAVVFGAAALAGGAVGPLRDEAETAKPHGGNMEGEAHGGEAVQAVRGLAVSDRGLTLQLADTRFQRDTPSRLAFRIVDRRGRVVRDFDVEHTKRMHVIVVRRDMTGFQHLHPTQAADGTWSVPVTLRDAGSYRVFADFSVNGTSHTLADDLTADGQVRSRDLPAPVGSVDVDGLRLTLGKGASRAGAESQLAFAVTRDGKPVEVQEYLGARGHLVALRQGDLAFLHVHPDEDSLKFMATFPTAGAYRLFLQFKVDGRVHTAALTQEVTR
jgi:hypothetical protein